jgi:hypothetical protein
MVRILYTVRWQIELLSKQLKSILRIHQSVTSNDNRLRCELYGKFMIRFAFHISPANAISQRRGFPRMLQA